MIQSEISAQAQREENQNKNIGIEQQGGGILSIIINQFIIQDGKNSVKLGGVKGVRRTEKVLEKNGIHIAFLAWVC